MPQVGPVRTDVPTVPPDVTAVGANVGAVVSDVTLVPRDITPVGVHIRLCGGGLTRPRALRFMLVIITIHITMQIALVSVDVAPISAEVRPVPLDIPAVLVDIRPIARDVALLILARALLGVFLPQSAFIGTQVGAIPLDVLAVLVDIRPVMRGVAPIARHILTSVIAGRLWRRLLIVGSGR
jgi:hypothetical protein